MFNIEAVYKAGCALGGLSLLVFLLGNSGLLSAPFLLASSAIAAAFFLFYLKSPSGTKAGGAPLRASEKALIVSILLVIISALPLALTPPSVRDELIQHLALPKLFLERGRIFEIPFMGFSYLPANLDLLYSIPLSLGSDTAPRVMHLGFSVLTGLAICFYLERAAGRAWGLLGFLIYISTPAVFNLSRMAYTDNGVAFYSTLSLIAALRFGEENSRGWLILSGVSMGFALGVKYSALPAFLLIGAFVALISSRNTGSARKAVVSGVIFFGLALIVLSPWLLRNLAWTGSPFYPLYESALHASGRGEGFHVTRELSPLAKRSLLYNEGAIDAALVPLRMFWEGRDNSIEKFDGVLNPVFLILLPFAFFGKRRWETKYIGLYIVLFFYAAFFTADLVIRYLMPVIPAVVILAALGAKNLFETRFRWLAAALLAAMFAFDVFYASGLYRVYSPLRYVTGREGRDAYLSRVLPDYGAVRYANENIPPGARVLFLFSGDRGYYWERGYVYGDRLGGTFINTVRTHRGKDGLADHLKASGITHLFINEPLFERFANDNFNKDELSGLTGFFRDRAARLYSSKGFSVYEIK